MTALTSLPTSLSPSPSVSLPVITTLDRDDDVHDVRNRLRPGSAVLARVDEGHFHHGCNS